MSTGVTPAKVNDSLTFHWATSDSTTQYYIHLYFAELQQDQMTKHNRQMYIYVNKSLFYTHPYVADYLELSTLYSSVPIDKLDEISINKAEESLLPPILNALEIYKVKKSLQLLTNQQEDNYIACCRLYSAN
ncbi:hypothetical protein Ddye_014392 [Dipteronia dyeriana]|uniref:Malectin-like domain-containing protein n=1 Tax=Dipteronia dyeriana TaxID=168575 RepID=A0AAE0CKK1_9ROSI|nr:hypothetical protein Ddye_014392 [Dipteronia dyeriana]